MRTVIRNSILAIIDRVISAVEGHDTYSLDKLSNYTIHNSSIFQDKDSLAVAIITYAMSKLFAREKEGITGNILSGYLKAMKQALKDDDIKAFRKGVGGILNTIENMDKKSKLYAQEVILKSRIKKGTAMFEHGISIPRAAESMGITSWDLLDYIGHSGAMDKESPSGPGALKRLQYTRSIFGD